MKKRRVILGILFPIMALTLSACDFLPTDLFGGKGSSEQSSSRRIRSNNGSTSRSSYNNNHVHRFSDEWSSNSQYHWHDAVCGHDVKVKSHHTLSIQKLSKKPLAKKPEKEWITVLSVAMKRISFFQEQAIDGVNMTVKNQHVPNRLC